jgi:hypothetical protein
MKRHDVFIGEADGGGGRIDRRAWIGGVGGALAALLATPERAMADANDRRHPGNPFILLLKGLYRPVPAGEGPADNLGLTSVNLNDGSYSRNAIYPVFGIGGSDDQNERIGRFYVQFTGNLCAYDLPGGSLAMTFDAVPAGAPPGYNSFVPHADGSGGFFLEATFELTIQEATGKFSAFQGGHNHMVDRLHQLANGSFDEFCFCNISQYAFP